MIDVKFTEAMMPLVQALRSKEARPKATPDDVRLPNHNAQAAAVVEALGIPAQMVANPVFMADLKALVARHTLPAIRADEPEAITAPGGPDFIPDPPACAGPNDNAT